MIRYDTSRYVMLRYFVFKKKYFSGRGIFYVTTPLFLLKKYFFQAGTFLRNVKKRNVTERYVIPLPEKITI
jgi:hypothetical protein